MESFSYLMYAIGAGAQVTDFMSVLPVEVSCIILRKLDRESLLDAALVNRRWFAVCKGDPTLRRRIRRYLREERKKMGLSAVPKRSVAQVPSRRLDTEFVTKKVVRVVKPVASFLPSVNPTGPVVRPVKRTHSSKISSEPPRKVLRLMR
ncbi:uncharacterized protein LOC105700945 [Orussus abietinus]|uniref:uncharacterized protein LOC105700945 n=1 Tax=Orussus abietinus TaxID=222816 RepID=UPI000625AB29|nr:uncharacterized protein LOC105700945 [Orussus abietinus]